MEEQHCLQGVREGPWVEVLADHCISASVLYSQSAVKMSARARQPTGWPNNTPVTKVMSFHQWWWMCFRDFRGQFLFPSDIVSNNLHCSHLFDFGQQGLGGGADLCVKPELLQDVQNDIRLGRKSCNPFQGKWFPAYDFVFQLFSYKLSIQNNVDKVKPASFATYFKDYVFM